MSFADKLANAWKASNSLVCVGLDPEPKKFPDRFRDSPGGIFEFNKAIVDATSDLVCAYKPQFAHYAAHAAENQLEHTIDYIKTRCPNAIVILDSRVLSTNGAACSLRDLQVKEGGSGRGFSIASADPCLLDLN